MGTSIEEMYPLFPEMVRPVERALSHMRLGWGWKNNEIIVMDLMPLGYKNFPLRIRLSLCMIELLTPLQNDPPEEELNKAFHSQWKGDSLAFPIYPTEENGRGLGLAVRLAVPEGRAWQKPSRLAPLLRQAIGEIASERSRFLEAEEKEDRAESAEDNQKDE